MFFFTASYNLVIPEMNSIISKLDGAEYKGWIIALFTISAGISRPFSGKLADAIGRKKVMVIGLLVCGAMSLLYPFCISVSLLLVLRFFHGFSTGFFPTGATALITDVIPTEKRGVAMGIWGTFMSLGMGVGQGFSTLTVDTFGANGMFFCALGLVGISYLLLFYTAETLVHSEKFKFSMLALKKDEIIEKNVIPVAVVMLISCICSGIILVLAPDISENLSLGNKGAFFVYSVLATIFVRLVSGGLSDRIGRRQTLLIGMSLLAISMYLVGTATTAFTFQFSSVLFGISTGICSPTLFAWTADLSPENRRGIGAGTMFIALELGICLGSIITNLIYQNKESNIVVVFYFGTGAVLVTIAYLVWHLLRRESLT